MKKKSNGQAMPREEGSRRAELVNAAARLFREKGFDATTIRDIAGAVGMGSGSPFCHFRSKQHILGNIVLEGMQSVLADTEALVARRMSGPDRFRAMVSLHLDVLHRPGNDFVAVMLYEWRALSPEIRDELVSLMDRYEILWHDCLRRLRRAGHLAGDDLQLLRQMILGAMNWSVRWFRHGGKLSVGELAEQTANLFLGLPAKMPEPARDGVRRRRPASAYS